MDIIRDSHAEGDARKLAAHELLKAHREAFVRLAQRTLIEHLLAVGECTIDDVRRVVPLPPRMNAKAFGVVPGPLAKAGLIARVGFAKTTRPDAHARHIAVWRLIDRAKAIAWLAANPLIEMAVRP